MTTPRDGANFGTDVGAVLAEIPRDGAALSNRSADTASGWTHSGPRALPILSMQLLYASANSAFGGPAPQANASFSPFTTQTREASTVPGNLHSKLIIIHDYSDTFTESSHGGQDGRNRGPHAPVGASGLRLEHTYGNAPVYWSAVGWSIVTDGSASATNGDPYPGANYRGSDSGFAELRHSGSGSIGMAYRLREDFVVQFDAVQPADWLAISAGDNEAYGDLYHPSAITVFFRPTGSDIEIGVGTVATGEINTGLRSGIARPGVWHNYGVRFDYDDHRMEFYVNEVYLGSVNLNTLGGGAMRHHLPAASSVTIGSSGGERFWVDNFQVGAPFDVPTDSMFGTFFLQQDFAAFANGASFGFGGFAGVSGTNPPQDPPGPDDPNNPPVDPPPSTIPAPLALPAGLMLLGFAAIWRRRRA